MRAMTSSLVAKQKQLILYLSIHGTGLGIWAGKKRRENDITMCKNITKHNTHRRKQIKRVWELRGPRIEIIP
jgi:hypothetical protein